MIGDWVLRIREKGLVRVILLDLLMLLLLLINLHLIIVDAIFSISLINTFLAEHLAPVHHWYDTWIHRHFSLIDLAFVGVFLLEFLISWVTAVVRQTYHRWFFYPFIHWYDLLGCIPVGSMRFLRILRIISILVKMQKLKLIDLTKTYLFYVFKKYLDVLTEEVSDRVVVNVLNGVIDEIKGGNPVYDQVLSEVVLPKKKDLTDWLANRVQRGTEVILTRHQGGFRHYVRRLTKESLKQNKGMKELKLWPIFGSYLEGLLEEMIAEITSDVILAMTRDLGSTRSTPLVAEVSQIVLDLQGEQEGRLLNQTVKGMAVDVLEIIKSQVQVQQWKLKDLEERAARRQSRLAQRS
jgi:hypothetical protein